MAFERQAALAVLRSEVETLAARRKAIFRQVAYVMRYSKGAVSYDRAMRMDGRRLRDLEVALNDLVNEEVAASGGKSNRSHEDVEDE